MAFITNAQLKTHCNEKLRVVADIMSSLEDKGANAVADYNVKDLGTIINNAGSSNTVDDGATTDGRTIVVGGDVFNMITLLNDFATFMTQGRKDVLQKWKVQGE